MEPATRQLVCPHAVTLLTTSVKSSHNFRDDRGRWRLGGSRSIPFAGL
jgi:hypothetical protein